MKKKITALVLVLSLFILTGTAFAQEVGAAHEAESALLRYSYIDRIQPELTVSGATATFRLIAQGSSAVTNMEGTLQLQKKNTNGTYSNYGESWTATSSSNSLATNGTKIVASGDTYRLKVTVTAYTSSDSSTETAYS